MNGSVLASANLAYLEDLYRAWKEDPASLDGPWGELFREVESSLQLARSARPAGEADLVSSDLVYKQSRVDSLIWAYREVGYRQARLNPLAPAEGERRHFYAGPSPSYEQLTLEEYGLAEEDLAKEFSAGRAFRPPRAKLSEIIRALRETYCSTTGVEFLHVQAKPIRRWLIREMESTRNRPSFTADKKRLIFEDLIRAEEFEHFMHTAFIGQKRFSIEGAESVIPALHHLVDSAHGLGIAEVVLGMTHRGRLTVLNRIMQKPLEEIFHEFEGREDAEEYGWAGDVRYHLGYTLDHVNPDGSTVRVDLVPNPSHLESVDPVVEGMARALQTARSDEERREVVPILLHGDAAFSGQGIVAETFNLSTLRGYKTGGTIHIVINNQIGFTTSIRDARSTFYPTDVAKMLPIPIFHVNGDDPEAVVHATDLALRFRQTFGRDAVVDVFCYRKYGHNEGDEPSFTHPLMYRIIERKQSPPKLYATRLRGEGVIDAGEEERLRKELRSSLRSALADARSGKAHAGSPPRPLAAWRWDEGAPAVPAERLRSIAEKLTFQPSDFHIHPKLRRIVEEKAALLARDGTVDWAFAESLAFGSLLLEGIPVRLSGQDSARGTFSQRHLVWWDTEALFPTPHTPLATLSQDQARFDAIDSPLSEYSILAFEYGYALGQPRGLTIWEAQYGDFANGAQVIVDNYVAAGEAKWGTACGVVLLLPHGYEGQGPEHSSGHLERYLALCAQENIQVCDCTTPAQYFHLLRRQATMSARKPLVVLSPKSLLRHPRAISHFDELATGSFHEVLDDPLAPPSPERLVLCSGKVFYELIARREELAEGATRPGTPLGGRAAPGSTLEERAVPGQGSARPASTAIVRIEQLYPFPRAALAALLARHARVSEVIWAQEEPRNRGAWAFVRERFAEELGVRLGYVGREPAASPATGSHARHAREQEGLLRAALPGEGAREEEPEPTAARDGVA